MTLSFNTLNVPDIVVPVTCCPPRTNRPMTSCEAKSLWGTSYSITPGNLSEYVNDGVDVVLVSGTVPLDIESVVSTRDT